MRKITVGNFRLDKTERDYIEEIMDSNWISEGKFVRRFEEEWAKYIGTKFSVVTNSGTSALIAAIFAVKHKYGIKDGSKVLTTPLTYNATVNAIVHNRLEPAFADIRMDNYCIDADILILCLAQHTGWGAWSHQYERQGDNGACEKDKSQRRDDRRRKQGGGKLRTEV